MGSFSLTDYLPQLFCRAKSLLDQIDEQLSFFERGCMDLPADALKLAIHCMKRSEFRNWARYLQKLLVSARKLIVLKVPFRVEPMTETQQTSVVSLDVLLVHLPEAPTHQVQSNPPDSLALDAGVHPALLLDDFSVKLCLENMLSKFKRQAEKKTLRSADEVLSSCTRALSSISRFIGPSGITLSVATQTDKQGKPDAAPAAVAAAAAQSTPVKNGRYSAFRVLYDPDKNFIENTSTLSNSPCLQKNAPVTRVPLKNRRVDNLSLTLNTTGNRDDASLKGTFPRRRKPWTLSETLMLWHEVQLALPQAPSWARIRDHAFSNSGRTNVDLKDRWRVVQRDPALQTEIRSYYEQWLATRLSRRSKS